MNETLRGAALPVAVVIASVGLLATGCSASPEASPPTSVESPSTPVVVPAPEQKCLDPSADVMSKVRQLINQPAAKQTDFFNYSGIEPTAYRTLYQDFRKTTAQSMGLTYFNGEAAANALIPQGSVDSKDPRPFSTFLTAAQDFAKPYGIDVTLAKPNDPGLTLGAHEPAASDLETASAKADMASIIEALGVQPVEFHKTAKLKHIVLMAGSKAEVTTNEGGNGTSSKPDDVEGYVNPGRDYDTMYLNVDARFSSHTVLHEEGHERDDVQCGAADMFNDQAFKAISTAPYTGTTFDDKNSYYTAAYRDPSEVILNDLQLNEQLGRKKQVCADKAAYAAAGKLLEYVSDYHPNAPEDKAEVDAELADDIGGLYLFTIEGVTESPLRKKAELELARNYMQNPTIVEFIAATSSRAQPLASSENC